ncbi:MAG TPA: G1 family glutamic endopeptidase [Solirubrobacteraceae bacterium]|nr:G1 family glutamic endopeptidase [Solirubrobacteraceae bacterium]
MSWNGRVRALACALVGTAALAAAGTASAAQSGADHHWPGTPLAGKHKVSNDTVTSSNWSGYAVEAASGQKFTNVIASWQEPSVSCTSGGSQYSSFWAGIDGYSSDSVEQTGADSDCTGRNRASYYAWYEMYPANSVELSTRIYPVSPGDTLTSEISVSGSTFTLQLMSSRGWHFTSTQSGSGLAQSSAEAIAESPEICGFFSCSLAPLANFGTMTFSGVQAAVNNGANAPFGTYTTDNGPHEIIAETSNGTVKAQPSALNGTSFSETWHHS